MLFYSFGVFNLALGLVTTYGLYMFRWWARPLSFFSVGLGIILYPMCSFFVVSGVTTAIDNVAVALGGAVLALAYFATIAQRFVRP